MLVNTLLRNIFNGIKCSIDTNLKLMVLCVVEFIDNHPGYKPRQMNDLGKLMMIKDNDEVPGT